MKVGEVIHLRGKTLRGKNRVNRGGQNWRVIEERWHAAFPGGVGWLVQSLNRGRHEMFWVVSHDPDVEVVP